MAAALDNMDPVVPQFRQAISMRDILTIVFSRFWTIACVSGGLFLIVAAITFKTPEVYESSAKILIRVGRENVSVDPTVVGPTMGLSRSRENEINSELSIISSRHVVEQVVDKVGVNAILGDDGGDIYEEDDSVEQRRLYAVRRIERNLEVEVEHKSNNISVQLRAHDPVLAQRLLNTLLEVYQRRHIEVYRSQASLDFFQQRVDKLQAEIEEKEDRLAAFQREHDIAFPSQQMQQIVTQITEMEQRSDQIMRQIMSRKARQGALLQDLKERDPYSVTERVSGVPNRAVEELKTRLVELRIQETDILSRYPDTSVARANMLRPLQSSIKMIEKQLKEEQETLTEVTTSIDSGYRDMVARLQNTETELRELVVEQAALKPLLEERREQLMNMIEIEDEINRMRREIRYDWDEYAQYREGLQRSKVSNALDIDQVSNVSVVQAATRAISPVSPNKPRNLALGLVISLLAGLGLALIQEHFDDRVKSAADVADRLNLLVLTDISDEEFKRCR